MANQERINRFIEILQETSSFRGRVSADGQFIEIFRPSDPSTVALKRPTSDFENPETELITLLP